MDVSVTVISYNSANTIIETLDSILAQSYDTRKIELIISDDASTDNCVDIINTWLLQHQNAFLKVNFIQNEINKGVTGNCNIAWRAATCDWIKPIAGDDMLKSNCISDNVDYVESYPECKIVFSKMQWFGNSQQITPSPYNLKFFERDSKEQNRWFMVFSFNIAPSAFMNKALLSEVGYTDNKFKGIEDLPLWLKVTKAGYKLHFLDKVTVKYRASESISMSKHRYVNFKFLKDLIALNKSQAQPFFKSPVGEFIRHEQLLLFKLQLLIGNVSGNKKNSYTIFLGRATWVLRPVHLTRQVKMRLYDTISSKIDK
jgi:glycosyltransferase involved in cell wall biosynthesis